MATLAQIRTAVDAKLAALWSAIQTREDAYFARTGRYWQGLRTATITPSEGTAARPDIGTRVPTDQLDHVIYSYDVDGVPTEVSRFATAWPAALIGTALPMALQIDTYDGPQGMGYVATVTVNVLGKTYERAAQVGPETWRQFGWRERAVVTD